MDRYYSVFQLIKASIWGSDAGNVTEKDYEVMKNHAILSLPAELLRTHCETEELHAKWKKAVLQQVAYNTICKNIQDNLPIMVPYVVLKGTTAAQYYPYPQFRTMGDIDIMTRHEDYDTACDSLVQNGYIETTKNEEFGRHRTFEKNHISVEVHSFFAMLNDPDGAAYLDNIIIENINPTHVLPDAINGLVLLEHINQHLEQGLGLRQIIDWMMFVDKCLLDEEIWEKFEIMVDRIGLKILAIVTTRMCEIYLGLSSHKWSKNTNETLCERLMIYIMSCGNFGQNNTGSNSAGINILSYARNVKSALHLLHERGMVNWRLARKYKILKPFASIYQMGRYIKNGLGRKNAAESLKLEYDMALQKVALLDALGVKQKSKGLAIYKDGKYTITYKMP